MINGADAGTQPNFRRRGSSQSGVEDDKGRAFERRSELPFHMCSIVCRATVVGVLGAGEGGRDADDGYR